MSSDIVLYGNRPVTSPYVMCVYVALTEKGLPFEFRQLDLERGEQHSAEYIAQSISNRVPCLICDGHSLSESSAITEYLEERFPPPTYPAIYPRDLVLRARVRMVQALVRSDFLPIRIERSTDTLFQRVPAKPLSLEAERARARLERIAMALVGDGRPAIVGEFSIADLDLATMLMRLVAQHDKLPRVLSDYARNVWQRPSVKRWLALTEYREAAPHPVCQ